MDAIELVTLLLSAAAGVVLGLLYFGGLWLTVNRLADAKHPGWLALLSFFVRLVVLLAGFYWLAGGHIERLLVGLFGFWLARWVLMRRFSPHAAGTKNG